VCSWLLVPAAAPAATWTVGPNGPLYSIQSAIDLASAGDQVEVQTGWYHERLTLKDGVSVLALFPGTAILEAEGEGPGITALGIGASTTVSGLVVQHGSSTHGGGLYAVSSSPTFVQCTFSSNAAVLGGGAYLRDGSKAMFVACTFSDNVATVGGGIYLDFSSVRLETCTLADNEASDGGALSASNAAEAILNFVTIHGNVARQGTTVACNLASPRFTNCTIAANADPAGTFGLRGSGTRVERCIVAFNAGPVLACAGFSGPWFGCNLLYGNGSEVLCAGDQGSNISVDPLFCDRLQDDFDLSANSPAAASPCGALGALPVACPAQGIETAVAPSSWTRLKGLYR
jgi:hypothetical protein